MGRWSLLIIPGKQRYDDREASEEWEPIRRAVLQDFHVESDDLESFMHSKRDEETQHRRARHDGPSNNMYKNMSLAGQSIGIDNDNARSVVPSSLATLWALSISIGPCDISASIFAGCRDGFAPPS